MHWGWKRGCCSLYNCIKVIDHVILTTFKTVLRRFWLQKVFFRKPFCQLNNWYVVKQRYKSLKVLYFCFSFLWKILYGITLTTIFWLWTSMSVLCASVQLIVFVLHLTFRGQHMVATSFFFKHRLYTDTLWPLCIYTFVVYTFIFSCFIDFSVFFE